MREHNVILINPLGLHARAAAKFVAAAKAHAAEVALVRGEKRVDGKSIMSVLLLAAPVGTELTLIVDGPDEDNAADALTALIADGFGELNEPGRQ